MEELSKIAALDLVSQGGLNDLSDLLVVEREELRVLADAVDIQRLQKAHMTRIIGQIDLQTELLKRERGNVEIRRYWRA